MKCTICHFEINGAFIGDGDGTGQLFAHPECYYRRRVTELECEVEILQDEIRFLKKGLVVK